MTPLIRNCPWSEVRWSKYRSDNIKNNKYYQRRQRFTVYSLAFLIALPLEPLGSIVAKRYQKLKSHDLAEFPNAKFQPDDVVVTFIGAIAAAITMALVFEVAYHFDLFWPERIESRCMQRIWRALAVLLTAFHGAATVATTYVVAQGQVKIHGVTEEQADAIRFSWAEETPLEYKHVKFAVICVILGWASLSLACGSVYMMIRSQVYFNKFGPFTETFRHEAYQRNMYHAAP